MASTKETPEVPSSTSSPRQRLWTPGPWHVEYDSDADPEASWPWQVQTADGSSVCELQHNGVRPEEEEPNGHLIAAAPELYEALERQIGRCGCGGTGKIPYEVNVVLDCTDPDCIAARAALAKARGE